MSSERKVGILPVSYTHLDVYKRQIYKIVANAKQILIYSNRKSAYIIPMEQIGDQYACLLYTSPSIPCPESDL